VLWQEPAHDRVGDRVVIHAIFAASDLLLYLAEAHMTFPFTYRLHWTDQLGIIFGMPSIALDGGGRVWTFDRPRRRTAIRSRRDPGRAERHD
jgi:hypothetical protein